MKLHVLAVILLLVGMNWICPRADSLPSENQYADKVEKSLRKAWQAEGHKAANNPAVYFTINKDGSISKVKLEKSSGNSVLDNQALALVAKSAPYPTPPRDSFAFATMFRDIDFGPYVSDVDKRIKRTWVPADDKLSSRIVVDFAVDKNGTASDVVLKEETGIKRLDDAALAAVKKASPFGPLPAGAMPVHIEFSFDYNVIDTTKNSQARVRNRPEVFVEADTPEGLNNQGVTLLIKGDFKGAIDKLAAALKKDPGYVLGKQNLAMAFNNLALTQRSQPDTALSNFCRALYLDPENQTTRENVHGILQIENKKVSTFDDFVQLGNDAAGRHESIEAYVLYHEALRKKADTEVSKKASDLESAAKQDLVVNEK